MRHILPRLSVLLFVLFLATIADIVLYLVFDARSDVLRCLPGEHHEMVGKLPESVQNVYARPRSDDPDEENERIALLNDKVLAIHADAPGIGVHFQELRGRVWRGVFTVSPQTPPGRYAVTVFPKEQLHPPGPDQERSMVLVDVFPDAAAMRGSYVSRSERFLGFGPWWVVMAIIPLAALLLVYAYRRAGKEEERLHAEGLGPIYKLAKTKDHWDIIFGLGSAHGVREGDTLSVLDPKLRRVGTLTALRVAKESSESKVGLDADISPFHVVSRTPVSPEAAGDAAPGEVDG